MRDWALLLGWFNSRDNAESCSRSRLRTERARDREAAVLRCCEAETGISARHEQGLRTNNRAENSHQAVMGSGRQQWPLELIGDLWVEVGRRYTQRVATHPDRPARSTSLARNGTSSPEMVSIMPSAIH